MFVLFSLTHFVCKYSVLCVTTQDSIIYALLPLELVLLDGKGHL